MGSGADWSQPVTLEGRQVRLEPLGMGHLEGLLAVGLEPGIWTWMPRRIGSEADMRAFVEEALAGQARGTELPFATLERASGRVVGSTRFLGIEPAHRRLEIGYTWIAPAWQRTALNGEAKLLMLRHAFEELGANRVEFKTDSRNERSRRALTGIGATEEGTLRNHMITHAPGLRHSVYFSVIADEWPAVRDRLAARLAGGQRSESALRQRQNQ
jgi:RimJ/RimL family protein N-acetyltransferase